MSDNHYSAESYGETAVADMAACEKANRVLQAAYPGHPWLIGVDHSAGAMHCRLMYGDQNAGNNGYGFLLHIATINAPDGEKKIMLAGGECLERCGLFRGKATDESASRAKEHGVDLGGIITKSRY